MIDRGATRPHAPVRRSKPIALIAAIGHFYLRLVRALMALLFGTALIFLSVLFVNYVVLATAKDKAYRDLDPHSDVCQAGLEKGWTILADTGRRHLKDDIALEDDGWADPSDNEADVVAGDSQWSTALRCALQRHVIPATDRAVRPLDYNLGFLEFRENGEPYPLVFLEAGVEKRITSAMLQHGMESEMHARRVAASAVRPVITQLDALKQHLATGSHYVIVFIHGWRHDARIGDQNIADLRLYAAHAARFLAQRCPSDPTVCDMDVTAVFIGWRGARVDELGLKGLFGDAIGGFLGNLSAGATLFDRKPVSEQVAPGAISALRTLEGVLAPAPASPDPATSKRHNKMIVFGHSLGGNMLATGLKDDLIKAVDRHGSGSIMPPILGDLVVLLNPAAEASKWTDIQREVWHRTTQTDAAAAAPRGDDLFPMAQKPVLVSVTAALAFPAGGLRRGDCEWIGLTIDDGYAAARRRIRDRLANTDAMFDAGVDYDWATHDLFPTFKLDFRPAAAFIDHAVARFEHRQPLGQSCKQFPAPGLLAELQTLPLRTVALLASTFPFQTSAQEQSHTIGNLDPPRPAAGLLADHLPSAAPFGTTHELLGLHPQGKEPHHPYATLADAPIDCPATTLWLTRARQARDATGGLYWDSEALAPGAQDAGKPAAHFLHGFALSGTAPITQANDPFWNMRAFDNALSRHDGYRLTSFICAMNQLVMDDITGAAAPMSNHMSDAPAPKP